MTARRLTLIFVGVALGASIAKVIIHAPGAVAFLVAGISTAALILIDDARQRGAIPAAYCPSRPVWSIAVVLVAAVGLVAAVVGLAQTAAAS